VSLTVKVSTMNPELPLNCPKCGTRLPFVETTADGVHVYECPYDGTFCWTEHGLQDGPLLHVSQNLDKPPLRLAFHRV
jgi:hypothetical protein